MYSEQSCIYTLRFPLPGCSFQTTQGSSESNSRAFSSEESDLDDGTLGPDREYRGRGGRLWLGTADSETEAHFREALDWCLKRITNEWQAVATTASVEQRQYEAALWDDELTRGGTV